MTRENAIEQLNRNKNKADKETKTAIGVAIGDMMRCETLQHLIESVQQASIRQEPVGLVRVELARKTMENPYMLFMPIIEEIRREVELTRFVYDTSLNEDDERTRVEFADDISKMMKAIILGIIDKHIKQIEGSDTE